MPSTSPGGRGDERIGVRALVVGHGTIDDHRGRRMDLVDRGERRAGQDRVGGAAAIGESDGGIEPAAQPAIPRIAAEEAVRDAAKRRRANDVHSVSRMTMSSSAWVPTMKV